MVAANMLRLQDKCFSAIGCGCVMTGTVSQIVELTVGYVRLCWCCSRLGAARGIVWMISVLLIPLSVFLLVTVVGNLVSGCLI
jgi:hypothetical protein